MAHDSTGAFDADVDTALVTGATGQVGSWVVDHLADRDTEVVGVDRERPPETRSNLHFRALDLQDQADIWETVHETQPDAVVHCAASSDLLNTPGTRLFENNTTSTYNTLVAAGRAGAEVVWMSSQAVYGALFAERDWVPDYLPIDEQHPRRPEDPYGTSKVCGEEVAAMVARRYDVPVTTLRAATIFTPGERRARPPEERPGLADDAAGGTFGSFVDVRDVSRCITAALAADRSGHEVFNCVADTNYLGPPTAELVESICGELPTETDLAGPESALSNAKARELLGWEPVHSEDPDPDASGPAWN